MTPRTLKIALAVSVALNLFAIGAAAGGAIIGARVADERRPPRHASFHQTLETLDPATRDQVHGAMRAVALSARPDFREARAARREAIALTREDSFDRDRIDALLARSREAEMRGRVRMEAGTVEILSTLQPADRASLASMLARHGHRGGGDRSRRSQATEKATPPSQESVDR